MPGKIAKGDRGELVERWQRTLVALGFDPNGIDGIFGNGCLRATREFQRSRDLQQDGIVGPKTWGAADDAIGRVEVLRRNSRGPDVAKWQRLMAGIGFDPNGIDGIFGSGTEAATKRFEGARALPVDGVVESGDWTEALGADVVAVDPPPPPPPSAGSGLLKDRIDASKIALAPPTKIAGPDSGVIRTWNRYGGILTELSRQLRLDPDAAAAVLAIESGGSGMTSEGPTIRFENHIFFDRWGTAHRTRFDAHFQFDSTKRWQGHRWRPDASGAWQVCHQSGQAGEWAVFRFAAGLDAGAAITSMSIGLAQIMGFHHRRLGYDTPQSMLDAFSRGDGPQILGFFDFVTTSSNDTLGTAIRNKDWYTFARGYNGSGKFMEYGDKMLAAYDQLRAAR